MAAGPHDRSTVDLTAYRELVVIYLGMRVLSFRGLGTLKRIGDGIKKAVAEKPDGLLLHEDLYYSFIPPHFGMRQYWRDLESLEKWTRDSWHRDWWAGFRRDPAGTAFWHETYLLKGGIEAIYSGLPSPIGLAHFAPRVDARGTMFSARRRLGLGVEPPPVVGEAEIEVPGSGPPRSPSSGPAEAQSLPS